MASSKDTIYIDIDDEITNIVEKVKKSQRKIVALVLPKRATVLQSIVNMKLLKKSAADAKKSIVLITSEAGLLPLAGATGLHVAKTLQSKPFIPAVPEAGAAASDDVIDGDEIEDTRLDSNRSIGDLAGLGAAKGALGEDEPETIDLKDIDTSVAPAASAATPKKAFNKRLRVPNFEKFRVRLFLGILLLILLIVGYIFAFLVMPKAAVTVKTDTSSFDTNIGFTAATSVKDFSADKKEVPATYIDNKKTDTDKESTTGQKDNGTKATGTMTLTNCINDGQVHTVPAGTGFASGSFVFTTDNDVTLDPALYSGSSCKSATFGLSRSVPVTAAQNGDKYNLSARAYTSPASLTTDNGSVQAQGSAMSGGTSVIVKVVAQSDIDNAKDKMKDRLKQQGVDELKAKLSGQGLMALNDTLTASDPVLTATPALGAEGDNVTVTAVTTYGMLGVKQDYLSQLVKHDIDSKIDKSKQSILDDGVKAASFSVDNRKDQNTAHITMQATAVAGPQLDGKAIAGSIRGKKKGDAIAIIQARPGIKEVTIKYSPFWVSKTPKAASKITVQFVNNDKK
jgi:hypothetical protein